MRSADGGGAIFCACEHCCQIWPLIFRDGQIIILHPGRTCGAIEFDKVLRDSGCKAQVIVAEAETFIYASRADGPAQSRIFRIKEAVPLGGFACEQNTRRCWKLFNLLIRSLSMAMDVLHTGLNNMGAIFHPAITILNAGWIESTHGDFQFYIDGVTPSVARILEVLDRERVTVASALGIRARTSLEWLQLAYDTQGDDLHEAIHNQPGYYGIKAPNTLKHRYIFEDVPMSLVPMAALGKRYGVSVRGMDSMIRLANFIHSTDYWRRGRTLGQTGHRAVQCERVAGICPRRASRLIKLKHGYFSWSNYFLTSTGMFGSACPC